MIHITPAVASIDANASFGVLAGYIAVDTAIASASTLGIGMVGVRNSNHWRASSSLVQRATSQGYAVLAFTNSSPAIPPHGGRGRVLGVSPIAVGMPGDAEKGVNDFVIDMAPSGVARGKIHTALRKGESIPQGWALDKDGQPTTDPAKALEDGATMLPMGGDTGGVKGAALAIMMDMFSGVLTGAAFAGAVGSPYDRDAQGNVGHFVMVIKPDLFLPRDRVVERMKKLYLSVVESGKQAGIDKIFFPGEIEHLTRQQRLKEGIPMTIQELERLNLEARAVGVQELQV